MLFIISAHYFSGFSAIVVLSKTHLKDLNIQKGKVLQMHLKRADLFEIDIIGIIIIARIHVCIYVLRYLKSGLQKPDRVCNTYFNETQ